MPRRLLLLPLALLLASCTGPDQSTPAPTQQLVASAGDQQSGLVRLALPTALRVQLTDVKSGQPVPGVVITWSTMAVGASVAPVQSTTDSAGFATTVATLGTAAGTETFHATSPTGAAIDFTAISTTPAGALQLSPHVLTVCAGVLHATDFGITATDSVGNAVRGLTVTLAGAEATDSLPPSILLGTFNPIGFRMGVHAGPRVVRATAPGYLPDSAVVTVASPCPVSINAVGYVNNFATNNYVNVGGTIQVDAQLRTDSGYPSGRTVTARLIAGGGSISPASYVTQASGAGLFNLTAPVAGDAVVELSTPGATDTLVVHVLPGAISLVTTVVHPGGSGNSQDTYVRDGLAFFSGLDKGIVIYDVGDGGYGGSPAAPVLVSQIMPNSDGFAFGGAPVRSWWFHNPVRGENRYLFVSQSGSANGAITGDIHIIDVSDLAHPVEVGFIHQASGGPRGLWVDEANQVLYAAYHGGGVIKIDVSGVLAGDLSNRIVASAQPGGVGHTDGWDVSLVNGALYYVDHASGFWALDPATLATKGGGNNGLPFGSQPLNTLSGVAISGNTAYVGLDACDTGDWGVYPVAGNGAPGAPTFHENPGYPCRIGQLAVTADQRLLGITTDKGLSLFDVTSPAAPELRAIYVTGDGFCSIEFAVVNGRTYAFLSTNDAAQGIAVVDVTDAHP